MCGSCKSFNVAEVRMIVFHHKLTVLAPCPAFLFFILLSFHDGPGGTHHMATRQTTEYLNSTNGYRTGQRFVGTHSHAQKQFNVCVGNWLFSPSTPCRNAIICGGMHLLQSSLKMMPCWPLLSVWRMDPNVTVRNKVTGTFCLSVSYVYRPFNPKSRCHKWTTSCNMLISFCLTPFMFSLFWSNWPDVDSKVLPEYIWGGCHWALLCAETS